jgi:hypothetical protein
MPAPEEILAGLRAISNSWRVLAVVWHLYFAAFALALLLGALPSNRSAGMLLGLPLLSVSILAWIFANPFNGTFFALAGAALIAISSRLPREAVRIAPLWAVVPGALMFAFGWVYPHFLDVSSLLPYLYSAPTGLIPCPTLSIVIGLAVALRGLGSRTWSLVLCATAIFYGVYGAAHLGVTLDWVLLLGALMLVLTVVARRSAGEEGAFK